MEERGEFEGEYAAAGADPGTVLDPSQAAASERPITSDHTARRSIEASLTAAGLGVLVASLVAFVLAEPPPVPPGAPRVWVADRDAGALYGLDADLYLARRLLVDWPLAVAAASEGRLWVLRADAGSASARRRLDLLDAAGVILVDLPIERAVDFDVLIEGERALVLESRAEHAPRLLCVDAHGRASSTFEHADTSAVVAERSAAVVGSSAGDVWRIDIATGAVVATAHPGGRVVDLARGPTPGSVWMLDADGAGRVVLLAEDLSVRWSAATPHAAVVLAPVAGEERVWFASPDESCVVRLGPGGVVEVDRCDLPLPGLGQALAWRDGVLVCAVGALLHLDSCGGLRPGQGGFEFVVDVARVGVGAPTATDADPDAVLRSR
jgi:hypothetical protein